ncbi:MAG: ABC transporter ATP-binding protein [Deltaproteobacteria bacterium]|nr:ABC transporter ATP-binding protein [Deltaproteobacteria bacterium]MBW2343150.1 ABC transporter ATP-binding protein [Deltaproteobacteria bacterium]
MFFETRDLQVNYEKVEAIKGISMGLEKGMMACIIGANGAGKTSILRTISALKKAACGEIFFQGKRIDTMRTHEIVKMGISHVPEGRHVFPEMSIMDNLLMGAYLRKDKQNINKDLDKIFEDLPILKQRQKQYGGSLSGGEQQMLTMARALMNKPKMLLLDEPTLGLSPLMVKEVSKIIQQFNANGVSIILVEQNSRVALKISQNGYVLETGSIVLQGKSSDLINDDHVKEAYLGA